MKRFPTSSQWKQIFKVLTKKETIVFLVFSVIAICSLFVFLISFYFNNTKVVPDFGGSFTEGVVGQPRLINPIYGETNDIDRSLVDLMFSGLMTYDNQGQLVEDLAKNYTVSDDGKLYDFQLKDNIFWSNGQPLTIDDIVFTIKTIQNSDYKSPLRANWLDVNVQKVSDQSIRFILKVPYNSFLDNLTVKILPKHIWENIAPENFTLSPYNLQPIGSGPFVFSNIGQTTSGFIQSIDMQSNRKYYDQPSYIKVLSFRFFQSPDDLTKAVNVGQIDGFDLSAFDDNEAIAQKVIKPFWTSGKGFSVYSFLMPRYFAVFFNNKKTSMFSDVNLREAMIYAVNKDELVQTINSQTNGNAQKVDSPILPDFYGYQEPSAPIGYDPDQANTLLDKTGYLDNGSGQREKAPPAQQALQFTSYLKIGSQGDQVTKLQSCLAEIDGTFKALLQSEKSGNYGTGTESAVTAFQKKYLFDLKSTGETGVSTRAKLNELCPKPSLNPKSLEFKLTTLDQPELLNLANLLKNYWQAVGVKVDINAVSATDLKPIIKNRSYDALLYGEALGSEPDLYPFWHSSQVIDPGLNLSMYESKNIDRLLQEARETMSSTTKEQNLEQLQDTIISDAPVLFLYNPNYTYWVSKSVKGVDAQKIIDPAKRFETVTNWHIKTHRVWR